jgi:hypothetical protein
VAEHIIDLETLLGFSGPVLDHVQIAVEHIGLDSDSMNRPSHFVIAVGDTHAGAPPRPP